MVERLNSLWVGERLGYIEQLCIASAAAAGHPFTLYSYTPGALRNVPNCVELRDAREIMPEERLVRYADCGAIQLGANLFRYELLLKDSGYWVDMDFCFLKPLDFQDPYVFGWEHENWINNALLRIPATSEMAYELCTLPETNRRPPWFGPRRTAQYYWKRLTKGDIRVQDLPWGTYSSGMVTYLARKYGVEKLAQKPGAFYPVRWKDAHTLMGPAELVESKITSSTYAVHLWYSRISGLVSNPPPKGSYLDKLCCQFGVDTSDFSCNSSNGRQPVSSHQWRTAV